MAGANRKQTTSCHYMIKTLPPAPSGLDDNAHEQFCKSKFTKEVQKAVFDDLDENVRFGT